MNRILLLCNTGIGLVGLGVAILLGVLIFTDYALIAATRCLGEQIVQLCNQLKVQQVHSAADQQKNNLALTELRQSIHPEQKEITLSEVRTLVQAADNRLQFNHDAPAALNFLQRADGLLARLDTAGDPVFYAVRARLASGITALRGVPPVDSAGLYARLAALSGVFEKLPLNNVFIRERNPFQKVQADIHPYASETPWWQRFLYSAKNALQQIVVVHHHVPGAPPFMTPYAEAFLYQNLHATVTQAEWAVLHHDENVWEISLATLQDWTGKYFMQAAPATKSVHESLAALQQVNVNPVLPEIGNILQMLQG